MIDKVLTRVIALVRRYDWVVGRSIVLVAVAVAAFFAYWLIANWHHIDVLNPQGTVAARQLEIFVFTGLLSLVVIVPVFTLLGVFAWRYREKGRARYDPNLRDNKWLEMLWWGIPIVIIIVLSVVTWRTSHELDPYRPLDNEQTMQIQVVALQWRWLFIYPEQGVASINQLYMPVDTAVEFRLTGDAPMNAFWIPSLGSQIYAMNGMSSTLHLDAVNTGEYRGYSTNISGEGYASMRFTTHVVDQSSFDSWVAMGRDAPDALDEAQYNQLATPIIDGAPRVFRLADSGLYDTIVGKYMGHGGPANLAPDEPAVDDSGHFGLPENAERSERADDRDGGQE